MLSEVNLNKLSCITCPLNCEIKPTTSVRISFCQSFCFSTWPEGSRFFALGITEGVLKKSHTWIYAGCVFVDFSISYFRSYLDRVWLETLIETKLKIILVCDRHLQALANYWFKNDDNIFLILYPGDKIDAVAEKIKRKFLGHHAMSVRGEVLSRLEFNILHDLSAGQDCVVVAEAFNLGVRSVYAAKQRVEKKMGADINDLFRYSYAV